MQYTGQKLADTLEIRIYKGDDGKFDLYEDEGDNYNYEKGSYTLIPFEWNEKRQTLTINDQQGSYPGFLSQFPKRLGFFIKYTLRCFKI